MKKVEEQWETIEGFTDYEISNFGGCRTKRDKQALKRYTDIRGHVYYCLYYTKKGGPTRYKYRSSPGMLVAKTFVKNPNKYKQVIYLDGNPANAIFTNIQWVGCAIGERSGKRRIIPREEQLKTIRRKIELAQKFERAIAEEREDAFVYGELKEEIQRIVNARFKEKGNTFKEWMIDSITETFADQTKRGYAPLSFNYCIAKQMNKLYGEYKNRPGTVQVNERIM